MLCPNCGAKTKVLDSRGTTQKKLATALNLDWFTYRKRSCLGCSNVFQTVELMFDDVMDIVAAGGVKPEMTLDDVIRFLQELKKET